MDNTWYLLTFFVYTRGKSVNSQCRALKSLYPNKLKMIKAGLGGMAKLEVLNRTSYSGDRFVLRQK